MDAEMEAARDSTVSGKLRLSAMEKKMAEASNLVGNIVEKGFSGNPHKRKEVTAPPRPSVIPFPIARHRSDGPHWTPLSTKVHEVDEDDEDRDETDFDPLSSFAHPVPRKQKKGLDFSKWRELILSDSVPVHHVKKEDGSVSLAADIRKSNKNMALHEGNGNACGLPKRNRHASGSSTYNEPQHEYEDVAPNYTVLPFDKEISKASAEIENSTQTTELVQNHPDVAPVIGSKDDEQEACALRLYDFKDNEHGSTSFMNDIDAENSSVLQKMSLDEIAEAQAEIVKKLQPSVVEMLKKRGREKLKKHKSVKSGAEVENQSDSGFDESCLHRSPPSNDFTPSNDATSSVGAEPNMKDMSSRRDNVSCQPFGGSDSRLWKVWACRVEKVRALRFLLDGSVADNDSLQVPAVGDNAVNVAERDFLRTEGDPGGAGYTIKEAVTLIRSMVPGQRAIALQLLATVLEKCLYNLREKDAGCNAEYSNSSGQCVDWQAIWAYALGPEPELVLSLRIALDDNNMSVILACIKVIQCLLSCDLNENFFNNLEKSTVHSMDTYTAPVFRSRPDIDLGFLHGGFWKYSTKLSDMLPFIDEKLDCKKEETEGEDTIKDDVVVAGQDVAAGFVRMGILQRITYLLEMDQFAPMEEPLVSVVTELARHSPLCSDAVMKCPKLVASVVNRFTRIDTIDVRPVMIKAIGLVKVLAKSDKKNCEYLVKHGIFQDAMRHLYKYSISLDHWKKSGGEQKKLTSSLMAEQLRLWRVCIQYGYCTSYFSDFFPALCFWLEPYMGDKFAGNGNPFYDYTSVAREAYLTLAALARRLPYLHAMEQLERKSVKLDSDDTGSWFWSHVPPVIELATKWLSLKDNACLALVLDEDRRSFDAQNFSLSGLLWVISAVLDLLSVIFERIVPNLQESNSTHVPWLPEFVPKIGIELVKNGYLKILGPKDPEIEISISGKKSLVESFCHLRHHKDFEVSLSSVCCLRGLIQVVNLVDKSIEVARSDNGYLLEEKSNILQEEKIVRDGIVMSSREELRSVLIMFIRLVCSEWCEVQSAEMFGRGGPAPGIGVGWGAIGGGFWSKDTLLARMDSELVMDLIKLFPITLLKLDTFSDADMVFALEMVNASLAVCLVAGPTDTVLVDKALAFLVQPSIMQCLTFCINHVLGLKKIKPFQWSYEVEDYLCFSENLTNHFKVRWLSSKRNRSDKANSRCLNSERKPTERNFNMDISLDTIHEDMDSPDINASGVYMSSMMVQWAHQRLPLPLHWFLSPISTVGNDEATQNDPNAPNRRYYMQPSADVFTVVKAGLLLLLGLESMPSFISSAVGSSPVLNVSLVWKLHSLSMTLLVKLDVLEDEKTRDIYTTLQEIYSQRLVQLNSGKSNLVEFLKFKSDIHESYPTFVETFIEHFSAVSYGDMVYGRQAALYLLRSVEEPVRLAAWNTLSNCHVLELLPPLDECLGSAEGYLEPLEDSEAMLDAYVKSWISGGLNKAFGCKSLTFMIALHHLSAFIFCSSADEKLLLRKKRAKSLLRGYSNKKDQESMMLALIRYKRNSLDPERADSSVLLPAEIEWRLDFLTEACEGHSSFLVAVKNLEGSL